MWTFPAICEWCFPPASMHKGRDTSRATCRLQHQGNNCTELDFTSLAWLLQFPLKNTAYFRQTTVQIQTHCKLLNSRLMLWQEWVPYDCFWLLENPILKPLKTLQKQLNIYVRFSFPVFSLQHFLVFLMLCSCSIRQSQRTGRWAAHFGCRASIQPKIASCAVLLLPLAIKFKQRAPYMQGHRCQDAPIL